MTQSKDTTRLPQAAERSRAKALLSDPQSAEIKMRLGKRARLNMRVEVTPAGVLAIAVLVPGLLLATEALVRSVIFESRR